MTEWTYPDRVVGAAIDTTDGLIDTALGGAAAAVGVPSDPVTGSGASPRVYVHVASWPKGAICTSVKFWARATGVVTIQRRSYSVMAGAPTLTKVADVATIEVTAIGLQTYDQRFEVGAGELLAIHTATDGILAFASATVPGWWSNGSSADDAAFTVAAPNTNLDLQVQFNVVPLSVTTAVQDAVVGILAEAVEDITEQRIVGYPTTPGSGSSASPRTYVLFTDIPASRLKRIEYYAVTAVPITIHKRTISGGNAVRVSGSNLTLTGIVVGLNTFDLVEMGIDYAVEPGEYLCVHTPVDGQAAFVSTGGQSSVYISTDNTDPDSFAHGSLNVNFGLQARFTLQTYDLTVVQAETTWGLPPGTDPVKTGGNSMSALLYVFNKSAPYDLIIDSVLISTTGGTQSWSAFDYDPNTDTFTPSGSPVSVIVPSAGTPVTIDVGLALARGQYLGIAAPNGSMYNLAKPNEGWIYKTGVTTITTLTGGLPHPDVSLQVRLNISASVTDADILARDEDVETIDLSPATSSYIVIDGNSYTKGAGTSVKRKAYIQKLNDYTDWLFFNAADGGNTVGADISFLRANTLIFGTLGHKDMRPEFTILLEQTNSANAEDFDAYYSQVRAWTQHVRARGSAPIFATEWFEPVGASPSNLPFGYTSRESSVSHLSLMAHEFGAGFIDLRSTGRIFNAAAQKVGLWSGNHPGTRMNELIRGPIEDFILDELPPPTQVMKIYTLRAGVSVSSTDDLVVNTKEEVITKFRPLRVGQESLDDGENVDSIGGSTTVDSSEISSLIKGTPVAFGSYVLVECVGRALEDAREMTLDVGDSSFSVYALDVFATPYEDLNRYQGFTISGGADPGVVAGDTYTSGDVNVPGTYTIKEFADGKVIMTTATLGLRSGAGTLTRTSGTGPATIAYTRTDNAHAASWYAAQNDPKGHWVQLLGSGGRFRLNHDNLNGKLNGGRIFYLVWKSGGGNLPMPVLSYVPRTVDRPIWQPRKYVTPPRNSLSVSMTATFTGSNGAAPSAPWSATTGSPTLTDLSGGTEDGGLPLSCSKVLAMPAGSRVYQEFTYTTISDVSRVFEIEIWARRSPPLYTPSSGTPPITEDSVDHQMWEVSIVPIASSGTSPSGYQRLRTFVRADLHWRRKRIQVHLPAGTSARGIEVGPVAGSYGQLAKVEIRSID